MEGSQKWTTPKYRAIGMGSTVDESLFGKTNDLSKSQRKTITGPVPTSAAVISAYELNRIRNESIIKTEQDLAADREYAQRLKEERDKLSKERKDRMRELEKKAVLMAKKSDSEVAEIARKEKIREMANKQMDENNDVIKLLNSMALRAQAYSIRDQQLEEKHRLEQLDKEFDRRTDMLIEIDRLKDIQRREDEERDKKSKRMNDRKVINDQIAQRQRARMLEMEQREQENQAMRNLMKRYEEEDAVAAAKRAVDIERSRIEVLKANEDAIYRKKEARQREKQEMEDILIYQAMKDAELQKREDEEMAAEMAKKERQAKLLAQQEKAQNNAGKMDELRARRAAEEKEREVRAREKADALKRKKDTKELLEARAKQAEDKHRHQQLLKLQQEDMVRDALEYSMKQEAREALERETKAAKSNDHRIKLHQQIEDRERERRNNRNGTTDEGAEARQALIRDEARLKVVRDKMVEDLIAQGVNTKYLSEMRNVDVGKILRR